MKYWHLLVWGWSLTSAIIPLIVFGGYEELETWCWIGADYGTYRMGLLYFPLWGIFLTNFVVIFLIVRILSRMMKNLMLFDPATRCRMRGRYRFVVFQTILFVVAGIVIWLPGTINRIWQYTTPDNDSPYVAKFLQALFTPIQGMLNLLIYVFPLHAQKSCLFICGSKNQIENLADRKSMREIMQQKSPVRVMKLGRSPSFNTTIRKETSEIAHRYSLWADEGDLNAFLSISSKGTLMLVTPKAEPTDDRDWTSVEMHETVVLAPVLSSPVNKPAVPVNERNEL